MSNSDIVFGVLDVKHYISITLYPNITVRIQHIELISTITFFYLRNLAKKKSSTSC